MNSSGTTVSVAVPWRCLSLQAVLIYTALLPLGAPMLSPVLPSIRDHFGIGDPAASLVMLAFSQPYCSRP